MYLFKSAFLFSLGKYSEGELLDHMVVTSFIFWRISILFSIVVAATYYKIMHHTKHVCLPQFVYARSNP